MRFLAIVAEIETIKNLNRKETFYIKIINPDGSIRRNEEISPAGYTCSSAEYLYDNDEYYIVGWGAPNYSTYYRGEYTVEVYHASSEDPIHEKMLIASKTFQLY